MIRYALKCADGHRFESWFQSASAYDALAKSGHLSCATCGSAEITKDMMTPRVGAKSNAKPDDASAVSEPKPAPEPGLTAPQSEQEAAIAALKAHVEANSTYVGGDFAKKAREMHLGDAPEQSIHGEAKPEEARALLEDGIPVAPLPFRPTTKNN